MKDDGNMRLCEITVDKHGIRVRHATPNTNPHRLSATQKFYVIITSIVSAACCAVILGFFSLLT